MKVIIDTNIIIDVMVQERNSSFPESKTALTDLLINNNECIISASAVTDIYYILRKAYRSGEQALKCIKYLREVFTIESVNKEDIDEAITSHLSDFEDAVLDAVANRVGCEYILTRNTQDFIGSKVKAQEP